MNDKKTLTNWTFEGNSHTVTFSDGSLAYSNDGFTWTVKELIKYTESKECQKS